MQKTVVVTGASSQLGVFLLPRLRTAGYCVVAVSRQAPLLPLETAPGVTWMQPEYTKSQGFANAFERSAGSSFLVSCGPLGLARELIITGTEISRVIAFSTSSVLTKNDSANRKETELVIYIARQENRLQETCRERGLPLLLLRPTLIYGCGLDSNISLLRKLGERYAFIPVAVNGNGLRQPVHADDLASLAVSALEEDDPVDIESEVCGGTTLSYREMAERVAASCNKRARLLALPAGLLAAAVGMLSFLPPWKGLNAEMVHRQCQNLVFDDSALREALNHHPRPFKPAARDFSVPEYAKILQLPEK